MLIDFLVFIFTFVSGIAIGYYICTNNYKKSGFLILEKSKWILDLHIPIEVIDKRDFITLKVIHKSNDLT